MQTSGKLLVGRFHVVVLRGDPVASGRLWACVRGEQAPSGAGWSGCWSREPATAPELRRLLVVLSEEVVRGGRSGPFGPYLDDHYFFEGWHTWGVGVPVPLADLPPEGVVQEAVAAQSIDELVELVAT